MRRAIAVLCFVAAGLAGRATIVDGASLALLWPAAGVAVVWFLALGVPAWHPGPDAALLVVATAAVNTATGAAPAVAAVFVVSNLVQVWTATSVVRRLAPRLWWVDGEDTFADPGATRALFAAGAAGSFAGAALGSLGLALLHGQAQLGAAFVWWGRNVVGIVVVLAVTHLVLHRRATGRRVAAPAGRLETAAVVACTAAVTAGAVGDGTQRPVVFLLVVLVVWAAHRTTTLTTALLASCSGSAVVLATLVGHGPLAAAGSPLATAVMAQLVLGALLVMGLAVSTAREERVRLHVALLAEREEVAAAAELTRVVLESITDGVTVVDREGTVVLANPASEAVLAGGDPTRAHDPRILDEHGDPASPEEQPWARALREGVVPPHDLVLRRGDGQRRVLAVTAQRLGERQHSAEPAAVVVYRDVTDERLHRDQLASFAGAVAHDLRGPLTSITGWTAVVRDLLDDHAEAHPDHHADQRADRHSGETEPAGALAAGLADGLGRIEAATHRMARLIDDLLQHAQARDTPLDVTTVDLAALCAEVAADRGVTDLVTVRDLPPVRADRALLAQVLDNLLGNAVKYVAPGATPRVEVEGRTRDGRVHVTVSDRGVGIPAEAGDVFAPFARARAADYPGTGLGLAICRTVVERHGGTIEAVPRLGGGTVVALDLPAVAAEAAPGPAEAHGPAARPAPA